MHVDSVRLRELRVARQWSQEQLATLSGLNLRTIQRLESGAKISQESLRAVFEVPAERLLASDPGPSEPALKAMREGVVRGLDFTGVTPRGEFWWFVLAVVMFLGLAQILAEYLGATANQLQGLSVCASIA